MLTLAIAAVPSFLASVVEWAEAFTIVLAVSLTIGWRPFIGPRSRPTTSTKFEATPQRIERGKYIFTALSACQVCHSQHDYSKHGNPVIPGTEGAGQIIPLRGLPGRVVAPNITPDMDTGAGRWSDDELSTLKALKGSDFEVVQMGTIVTQ